MADGDPIRPTGAPPPAVRFCRWCGHPFWPQRHDQTSCSNSCRRAFHHHRDGFAKRLFDTFIAGRRSRARGWMTECTQIGQDYENDMRRRRKQHAAIRAAYEKQQREPKA